MGQGVEECCQTLFVVSPIHMDCFKSKIFALGLILEKLVH